MSSQQVEQQTAETSFRQAFDRLKAGESKVLPRGAPVTQNNVAREASRDPTALKKARYPLLIREIQAYVELHEGEDKRLTQNARKRRAKRSAKDRLDAAIRQRDAAQSILASANMRIVDLIEEVRFLQVQLMSLRPPPTALSVR